MAGYGSGAYGTGAYGTGDTTVTTTGITVVTSTSGIPCVEIIIATPDGALMDAVTVTRTAAGVTEPTRVQPLTGFASRLVVDYGGDWEAPLTYTATVVTGSTVSTYTSGAVTLSPGAAWAIHPTSPGLSVCIDRQNPTLMQVLDISAAQYGSTATTHTVIDNPYPVVTTLNGRSAATGTMTLLSMTKADAAALRALTNDETPLRLMVPPSWAWDWDNGYYSLGDIAIERLGGGPAVPYRQHTWPFTRVDTPAGAQQSTWSYADLLDAFEDYPSVQAAFADYPSLQANLRR